VKGNLLDGRKMVKNRTMETSKEEFSLLSAFDELTRNTAVLSRGIEQQFLQFVENCGNCRQRWENAELECQRLNIELTRAVHENQKLQAKLNQARIVLDQEQSLRRKAEGDRDRVLDLLTGVRDLVEKEEVGKSNLEKIRDLTLGGHCKKKLTILSPGVYGSPLCPLEITEEKSVLDVRDLSYDDHDETNKLIESPAVVSVADDASRGRKRNRSKTQVAATPSEEIFSHVKTKDASTLRRSERHNKPESSINESNNKSCDSDVNNSKNSTKSRTMTDAEKENLKNGKHNIVSKTALKSEKCSICDKRVKFGKICLRCSACKMLIHTECEEKLPGVCTGPPPSPIPSVRPPGGTVGISGRRRSLTPAALTLTPSSKRQRRQMFQSPMLR